METMYRAVSFGRPVGPWRKSRDKARSDLIDQDLGSYDEWGIFWVTVPGDIETMGVAAQFRAA